ncbi:MAG: TRAP transporter substrate-binding protein [Bryobacterales bacterium]|nr:TRAP transporter substrate-binding protein [Bryobacterales bacterium]
MRLRLGICLCSALAAACASCAETGQSYVFRYANSQPAQHPRSVSMAYFKKLVEERTNGRIKADNHFGGTLGRERELMDLVAVNVLQGTRGGFFFDVNPKYTLLLLPFLVEGWDQALRLVNSSFTAQLNMEGRKNGYHVPACGISQGFRAHTTSVRPIQTPADFKGLKLRVPAQELNILLTRALGANPQQIPFAEVYQACKTGVIDGQDNAPSNLWDLRIHEVQKYLSISNYMTGPDPFIVNLAWYESLPAELQRQFDSAAREAISYSDRMNRDSEREYIDKLSAVLQTNWIEGEALAQFRAAAAPVYDILIAKGYFTWEDVEAARLASRGEQRR